jgi:hypothetical protein
VLKLTSDAIHPIVMSLIFVGFFFSITFTFFSIVFFIHRRQLQRQYQLQEKFNQIAQFLAVNKFKYLEVLSKSNAQLNDLMKQINEGKQLFAKQLEIVRQKIISLSLINFRYCYLKSYHLGKEIKIDLDKCETMVNNLRNISSSATSYSKDISDLIMEYRQITDEINHFYELNLSLRYKHIVFHNMYNSIREVITQATEYIVKFDNNKLLTILHDLNQKVSVFYKIILQLYTLDRVLMYLETLKKKIKSQLESVAKILSSSDYSQIETAYATGSSNTTLLEKNLKNVSFGTAKNNAIIAVKHLTDALNKIESGDHTNILIQKDMKYLKDQIAILKKEFNDLNTALNNIQRNFVSARDTSIINKITNLNSEMKFIILFYQNLENEFINYKLIERAQFLNKIKELADRITA